ncbi:MAG: transglycosylase domain-containing protein, partial [Deltaproteobacteria bacterium]
ESYFGKNVEALNLAEAAMLAGLPKAPSTYSPHANFGLAKTRQEFILGRMVEERYITPEEADAAIKTRTRLKPKKTDSLWVGPYFTEHVRRYLEEKYGADLLYKGGLKVYTTMDVEAQQAANEAVRQGLLAYDKRHGYRGPVTRLKTAEEFDGFREESDKKLSERPLEAGRLYQAAITSVNAKNISLSIEIGGITGLISQPELEWAKLYNPTGSPDGGKPERFDKIFRAGDVVDVSVISIPQSKASITQMRLEQRPQAEASLVAMEPETGFVKAMVGGFDFSKTQFNRAVQALRQPGSAFKAIIYTAAIDKNYTPATVVMDTPIVFDDAVKDEKWRPRNFDEKFFGPTTVRKAIARSRN